MSSHDIVWEDDGAIGYRCLSDQSGKFIGGSNNGATDVIRGVNEGDKVVTCPRCGQRLKASWSVRLVEE